MTATFTVMPAVLPGLMRYEKQPNRARQDALLPVARRCRGHRVGDRLLCRKLGPWRRRGFVVVAALGCIVYEVVKAHGSLPRRLRTRKADLAKAEATVESLVTAAKKAV